MMLLLICHGITDGKVSTLVLLQEICKIESDVLGLVYGINSRQGSLALQLMCSCLSHNFSRGC